MSFRIIQVARPLTSLVVLEHGEDRVVVDHVRLGRDGRHVLIHDKWANFNHSSPPMQFMSGPYRRDEAELPGASRGDATGLVGLALQLEERAHITSDAARLHGHRAKALAVVASACSTALGCRPAGGGGKCQAAPFRIPYRRVTLTITHARKAFKPGTIQHYDPKNARGLT